MGSFEMMKTQTIQKRQILVVDDEPSVRGAIKILLKHDGHEIQLADSGEAALAMFERDKFDLVITDYSMQGMKGAQLAVLIKQLRPDQPIIMITAFADEFKTYGKPPEGVDFIISKPFSQKELREAIIQVLP
jgi:CheY-like chemotaxis protein